MKSLFRIVRRYTLNALLITLAVLSFNVGAFIFISYNVGRGNELTSTLREDLSDVMEKFEETGGTYTLSQEGCEILEERDSEWGMLLNQEGTVVWEWNLPGNFPRQYSLSDVASFTRWYFQDYPVRVWGGEGRLLVIGMPKSSQVKLNLVYPASTIRSVPMLIHIFLVLNIFLLIGVSFWLAFRFYRSLKPVAEGIDALAEREYSVVPERGATKELAQKLNKASHILQVQEEKLQQRDDARTTWISGVSHDIRTPLALILGISDELSADQELSESQRRAAEHIKRQSLQIRQLIADLNLTSKLEYNAQPLRISQYRPAALIREAVTEYYNGGLDEAYSIQIHMGDKEEELLLEGDTALLKRALQNVIGNSIRHNPGGAEIDICLKAEKDTLIWDFMDSGSGIPGRVAKLVNQNRQEADIHIMGLRIVRQVLLAHGGRLTFPMNGKGTYGVRFLLPLKG